MQSVGIALSARHCCNSLHNCLFYGELFVNVDICDAMYGFNSLKQCP